MERKFRELSVNLNTPRRVQEYISSLNYNTENTVSSALTGLLRGSVHCIEAAFLAAAILEHHQYPALILDLESADNLDHVVYLFQERGKWGAIGRSRDAGLEGRSPVFKSVRDLAYSYYDPYVDETGRLTAFAQFDLGKTPFNWRTARRNLWRLERYLIDSPHYKIRIPAKHYHKLYQNHLKSQKLTPEKYWW